MFIEFNCMMLEEDFAAGYRAKRARDAATGPCTADWKTMVKWLREVRKFPKEPKKNPAKMKEADLVFYPWDQTDENYTMKAVHFTYVFQIFVFMQVFNQINARKLQREFNVFGGIFNNVFFFVITIITIAVQMLMVLIGGRALKSYPLGWA